MARTKWCELCDEIEAQHAGNTLCWNCYMRVHYATKKGVAWMMQRRKNLKLYMRTQAFALGDVTPIDIADDKEEVA